MKRTAELNKVVVEVWKGHGQIVIIDRLTGKRITANIELEDKIAHDYDTEFSYGGNGYTHMRIAEDVFT